MEGVAARQAVLGRPPAAAFAGTTPGCRGLRSKVDPLKSPERLAAPRGDTADSGGGGRSSAARG